MAVDSCATSVEQSGRLPQTPNRAPLVDPLTVSRNLSSFASLGLFVFAVWQTYATLSRTPAFNPSLRLEDPGGRSYLGGSDAMYQRAEYAFWIGFKWTTSYPDPGEPGAADGPERDRARAIHMNRLEAATEGLRNNPGMASAWMLAATAQAGLGDGPEALAALLRWHETSPHNAAQADARLGFLIRFMSVPQNRTLALSMISPDLIAKDLRTIEATWKGPKHAGALSRQPAIAAFGVDPIDPE